ncbi:MAG TPA: hypothetical protein DHW63_07320 [Hyphomonadaceae bacterium]|nr:hypothetical protein [Hyphomonadaceae bacterium]
MRTEKSAPLAQRHSMRSPSAPPPNPKRGTLGMSGKSTCGRLEQPASSNRSAAAKFFFIFPLT